MIGEGIDDRDKKFSELFDGVCESMGMDVIHTPVRAPNANAYAERWVISVRQECLDKLLILNELHLQRVLRHYVAYYNGQRPHQGLDQRTPIPRALASEGGRVCRS